MKANGYKLISDREPTNAELNSILNAATATATKKAVAANEKASKLQEIYYKKIKETYSKKINLYASKA